MVKAGIALCVVGACFFLAGWMSATYVMTPARTTPDGTALPTSLTGVGMSKDGICTERLRQWKMALLSGVAAEVPLKSDFDIDKRVSEVAAVAYGCDYDPVRTLRDLRKREMVEMSPNGTGTLDLPPIPVPT